MSGIFSIFLNKLSNVDLLQVPRTLNNFVLSILIFLYLKKYKARVIRVMIWITYLADKKKQQQRTVLKHTCKLYKVQLH